MNYDRRFSPQLANNDYSRTMNNRDLRSQQNTPRGVDSRAPYYGKEYPPLRSKSQNNVEQDYGERFSQQPQFYDNRALDKNVRSRSLDTREFRGDDGYYRDEPHGGVIIPIRRETARGRPTDVRSSPQVRQRDFEPYQPQFDDRRPIGGLSQPQSGEVQIPYNRDLTIRDRERERDRDIGPPRQSYDYGQDRIDRDRGKSGFGQFRDNDSPKSYSSRYQDNRRVVGYGEDRGAFGYADEFDREKEDYNAGALQPYRGPVGGIGQIGGGGFNAVGGGHSGGGYRSSSHHRSHHESYGGGGHDSTFVGPSGPGQGRVVTQQPQMYHADGRPMRPIQHHRVQCCCFRFVWPPWSYEQAPAPQPIYRNI